MTCAKTAAVSNLKRKAKLFNMLSEESKAMRTWAQVETNQQG